MPLYRLHAALTAAVLTGVLLLPGCNRTAGSPTEQAQTQKPAPESPLPGVRPASISTGNMVRATGLIQALQWQSVRAPQLTGTTGGNGPELILTAIVPNGAKVAKGEVIATYDRLNLLDQERDAVALEESLKHQLAERKAQVLSLQATRASQIREAQADLERAQLQLRKGPVLSEIDRLKNEAKAENAAERLKSLHKSNDFRTKSEDASVRILDLKLARQRVTLERLRTNLEKLMVKAPQDGMVAHETTWRQGNMGPPQVGDRMWPGMPLVRIFDPREMVVQATVDEPDFASISSAKTARVYLDAYSGETFTATLRSASPVATGGIDTPVRNFTVVFQLDSQSPRLLPDLSAALEIDKPPPSSQPATPATPAAAPRQTATATPPEQAHP